MGHNHKHNDTTKNLFIAFLINVVFTIIEIFGGLYTNSIAILSDAVHDLGDSISLGASVIFERVSKKSPDERYTYGYQRFSLLGALFSSLVLFGGTVYILIETIPRLINPEEVDPIGMVIFAVLGVLFNGFAYFRTHKGHTLHEKSVSLHLLEDMIGWIAILIGSIILLFVDFYRLDAILSIGISLYILFHVYRNLKEIFAIFLQKVPRNINLPHLLDDIESIDGIVKAHHCHIWSLSDDTTMMSVHIVLKNTLQPQEMITVKNAVRSCIEHHDIDHITIECHLDKT